MEFFQSIVLIIGRKEKCIISYSRIGFLSVHKIAYVINYFHDSTYKKIM